MDRWAMDNRKFWRAWCERAAMGTPMEMHKSSPRPINGSVGPKTNLETKYNCWLCVLKSARRRGTTGMDMSMSRSGARAYGEDWRCPFGRAPETFPGSKKQ